mgnify:CR=1 FL=1
MLEEEIKNKQTTVWTTGHIFKSRDFWFAAASCGLLIMGAVGTMTQSNAIISSFPELNYTIIMLMVAIFGAIGSWLLGVFDTRFGTKKSMIMAMILMILSGVCGALATATGTGVLVVIALIFVAMFMGSIFKLYRIRGSTVLGDERIFSRVCFACVKSGFSQHFQCSCTNHRCNFDRKRNGRACSIYLSAGCRNHRSDPDACI